ncbi:hypothetical protein MATL_G00011750 [Megalops atlanticus]|uniref:Anaphase-promoting complex subunit 4-like WD40 domain-containing protein n=1 Tax=Megalops atlanticus TaxID=7932 RepID=A0A9D3QHB3_MEGAT|nr:hypothetical protein MATL_G00011750 [Megalops atlanticus]
MSGAFPSASRNGMLTAPPPEAVNDLPQNSEHKPEQTDMLTSNTDTNTDTDTEAGSTLDTDTETECDLDTERHTDSPGCTGQTVADNNDHVTQTDTLRDTETDTSTDRQPRTKGDLHIRSVLECGREVMVCQFNNEGTLLAVGLSDGTIKVYSLDSGSLVQTLKDRDSILSPLPVTALRFTVSLQSHSLLLATYASGNVRCWYVWARDYIWGLREVGESNVREEGQRQTLSLSLSTSGETMATGGSDSVIHLYDLHTHQRLHTYSASSNRTVMDGHRFRVFAVNFHPNREREFISGGWDNTVQFWDTRQQNSVRMVLGPHVCGDCLQIDPVANHILSGSWRKEKALEIFDYDSGQKIAEAPNDPQGQSRCVSRLIGLPSAVFSSSVCPKGRWMGLIAASSGKRVFLLDRSSQ